MADEKPAFQVDDDWKKQAQEEKRRLAEEEAKKKAAAAAAAEAPPLQPDSPAAAPVPGAAAAPGAAASARGSREMPTPTIESLAQSLLTQILYSLGAIATRGQQPQVDLDMAKHLIETLGMLEEKTKGNLTEEETQALQTMLYESRMRYVSVAQRYIV